MDGLEGGMGASNIRGIYLNRHLISEEKQVVDDTNKIK
jgi:hypothetical protein